MASIVWFRRDLRLADNPALQAAIAASEPVIPVFIWAPEDDAEWPPGAASRWWLQRSLAELGRSLEDRGSRLVIRRGPSANALARLAAESGARRIFWNRCYEPAALALDASVEASLRGREMDARNFPGNLLFEPGTIRNGSGGPFQVFTAFWKACQRAPAPAQPTAAPKRMASPAKWPESLAMADLDLEPTADSVGGLRETWQPGETGGVRQMRRFLRGAVDEYIKGRDVPGHTGTSRLSPHLHFGEVSARQIWHAAYQADRRTVEPYVRQIVWREFAYHLLFHFPQTPHVPLREQFRRFSWLTNAKKLTAWQQGRTGYPLVDAGMRELWQTGWMHNRVRMVAASFLVKHLLISWRAGAAWFWNTLVDADLANNTLGWQWCAGCGADAAPYFRIFNPVIQARKFDSEGAYVRRWIPELARLPDRWIHIPWEAPEAVLADAEVKLGRTYPRPIVVHKAARERALAALAKIRAKD
jgi:deoxyribodipyrimidine photo-lyase